MKEPISKEILASFVFPSSELARAAMLAWLHWPLPELRAIRISTHEVPREGQVFPASDDGVAAALRACPIGFFLFGPRKQWKVNATFGKPPLDSTLDYWLSDRTELYRLVPQLMELFDGFFTEYAYAGHWSELCARNQLRIRLGAVNGPQTSGFYGRDFRRYLPGLYWYNYLSDHYCATTGIDVERIRSAARAGHMQHRHGHSFQLYDDPREWQANYADVSKAMDGIENIFRREKVEVPDYVEYSDINDWIVKLGQAWP